MLRRWVVPVPGIELERDESDPPRHLAGEARQAQAGVRRGRHGDGRQLLAAQRRRGRDAARPTSPARAAAAASRWRGSSVAAWPWRRPRRLRDRTGRGDQPGARARPGSDGTTWPWSSSTRRSPRSRLADVRRLARARPREAQRPAAARSRSDIRWAPRERGSSARSPTSCTRRGGGYGVATLCIGVGQGLAVVLEA